MRARMGFWVIAPFLAGGCDLGVGPSEPALLEAPEDPSVQNSATVSSFALLGTLPGHLSAFAWDVNSSGTLVGRTEAPPGGLIHWGGVRATVATGVEDLRLGSPSDAIAISEGGTIVGALWKPELNALVPFSLSAGGA